MEKKQRNTRVEYFRQTRSPVRLLDRMTSLNPPRNLVSLGRSPPFIDEDTEAHGARGLLQGHTARK